MTPKVHVSLAAFPGLRHVEAATTAILGCRDGSLVEPLFGCLSDEHVQLVPQNFGIIDEQLANSLCAAFPATQFRLHANVRLMPDHRIADLSGFHIHLDWFEQAAAVSRSLGAPAYSAHSGLRSESSMQQMLDQAKRAADLFGCPVAVEGQYPTKDDRFLVSSWDEYRVLFESGVPYVVDLSHIHILASKSGKREMQLLCEMLANDRCIEVHVSDNDGSGDWHQICEHAPWWYPLLANINENAVVFSEGNHRCRKEN